jgi:REP element-mobilizing transposase RayT
MSQKLTPLLPEQVFHIWTHANGDENLFRSEANYLYFLKRYNEYVHPISDTYAYCLMPNHLHLMLRFKKQQELCELIRKKKKDPTLQGFGTLGGWSKFISQQFSNMLNGYTQSYNRMYGRKGSLFIPNFRRKEINSEDYFGRLVVYIHNNPVYHGFVEEPGDWLYSSWHSYKKNCKTHINTAEVLQWFGGFNRFSELHRLLLSERDAL